MRVAILDSGLAPGMAVAAREFCEPGALSDHGDKVAALVREAAPQVDLLDGRVFGERLQTSVEQVAEALDWAVGQGAGIINLSLGLREDRARLRLAIEAALAAGVVIVAPAPARGGPVYPSAYAGVIAVTGDARCGDHDFSWLGEAHVDFGACPRPLTGPVGIGGASFAAARVTGALARLAGSGDLVEQLRASCRFTGRERR
ncbi:subtilisin-like serine protease QhpE [Govanella unica]|uniref:S8 family serine peptidase n=1 Tax=Govanella unica TaxID=2975056 RepID=A0A9X3TUY9_9PROT|nr:S8 family serine peptidase [Govania unica]MDA5192591.1 S8 family serine peptidase [Govania unica]